MRPTVTRPICLSPPAHGAGDSAGGRGDPETELGELDGHGDGTARGDAGTLALGAWATALMLALDEAAAAGGNVKTTAKTKAKTATHTSRRFGRSTTHWVIHTKTVRAPHRERVEIRGQSAIGFTSG